MVRMSTEEYRRRDVPLKCARCRYWMRRKPTSARYRMRAPVPFAASCVDCIKTPRGEVNP